MIAGIRPDLLDLRLQLVFTGLQSVDLDLGRLDQQVELADLGRDLLLLGRDLREDAGCDCAQFPISGPLIQPCRIAYTTACVRSFTESFRRMLDM